MNRLTRRTALALPLLALPLAQSVPASAAKVTDPTLVDMNGQRLTIRAFEAWTRAVAECQISGTITGMVLMMSYDTAAIWDTIISPLPIDRTSGPFIDSIRVRAGMVEVFCLNVFLNNLISLVHDPFKPGWEYLLHNFDTDLSHYELGKWDE